MDPRYELYKVYRKVVAKEQLKSMICGDGDE